MPAYDFKCNDCGKIYEVIIKNSEKSEVVCVECGSSNKTQMVGDYHFNLMGNWAKQGYR